MDKIRYGEITVGTIQQRVGVLFNEPINMNRKIQTGTSLLVDHILFLVWFDLLKVYYFYKKITCLMVNLHSLRKYLMSGCIYVLQSIVNGWPSETASYSTD